MRRTAKAVAAVAGLSLALAACGGDSGTTTEPGATQSSAPTANPADIKADLTWWDTSDATNEAPAFKELITEFNKTYPNVKINYQSVPFGEAQNKFKTAAAAKSGAPDILRAEVAWVPEFASLGYLYELDGTELTADASDFLPAPAGSTKYNGKTYGVPQVTDSLALMYNKKLLEEAGVEAPTTWDEMKAAAATIEEKTGKTGVYLNPQGYFMLPFIYGEGGDLIDPDAKKITVNSPEAVAGVKKAQELLASPGFAKPPATDAYTAMMNEFKAGNAAMIINGPWEVNNIKGATTFGGLENLGIAPVPAGSVKAGAPVGGHNYVVWSGMPQEKAQGAIAFVKFMASAESQAKLADTLGLLPTRTSAYDQVTNPIVGEFQPVMEVAVERAWIPEGGKLFGPLDEAATKMLVQGEDAQQALDDVARKYKTEAVKDYATQ
ncbi:extracellular solute-binding protein [Intrasporangium sp.]|uniref:extracellular solute-binding protein n=1 Tax=Intrasporangium sp. TaxID=1925024 RepID=UPI00293AA019|nr:extracellular solute-binding protein [Intrasporangium sp.]MDV3223205.1 extracellular solute-binding protein [Intrasporangium sp.]